MRAARAFPLPAHSSAPDPAAFLRNPSYVKTCLGSPTPAEYEAVVAERDELKIEVQELKAKVEELTAEVRHWACNCCWVTWKSR